ncbi:MAG: AAA family ATPase [Smithella sp.]|nr:AAA family ATPase [Smithella sp.]
MNKKQENQVIQNNLATKTDSEILAKQYGEPEFIVPQLISVGLAIAAGKPKSGKSLLTLDMALALANGSKFLGLIDVAQQEVLFLALEDSELRLQKRINQLTQDPTGTGRLHFATECAHLDQGFFEHLENLLSEKPQIRLVVIDTFNRVRKLKRRGTTPYEKDYNEMNELKKFADDHNIAILVIHHLRKSEAADVTDMISGSIGIAAAADSILILRKERGSNQASLFVTGRDIPDFEIGLTLNPESLCWEISTPTEQLTNERAEVLAVVERANGPMKLGEIAEAVSKKKNNVHKLLAGLIVSGQIKKTGYGVYELNKDPKPTENGENESECGESGESSTIAA